MLKMGELLRDGDIDELVERDAFPLGECFSTFAHRGHEPERKLARREDFFSFTCIVNLPFSDFPSTVALP